MYPQSLELKTVCESPETIDYLDITIRHDRGGFHTLLYDKRDAMRGKGMMGRVRRFPHPTSALSTQCLYGCMTSFMHRAYRCTMRDKMFVREIATRVREMCDEGYTEKGLLKKVATFLMQQLKKKQMARSILARVKRDIRHLSRPHP